MMKKKTATEAICYRRSVRIQSPKELDTEAVRNCIQNATLAPNSSNMQLWEFYHITSETSKAAIVTACFGQPAAKTAQQLVIPVVRRDLWPQRLEALKENMRQSFQQSPNRDPEKETKALAYYENDLPKIYQAKSRWQRWKEKRQMEQKGRTQPVYREIGADDLKVIGHKSVALAAQNFMISMAEIGYDTCPMEGFDSQRIISVLNLPKSAEISMVIGCGIREERGVYGPQFRVPFDTVYFEK